MKMLAANRLSDGEAVWLAADGNWVDEISHAETVRDKDGEERLLAAGRDATGRNEVVDAELVDVEIIDGSARSACASASAPPDLRSIPNSASKRKRAPLLWPEEKPCIVTTNSIMPS